MAYPNTSDFTLPADDAAWWLIRIDNADGTQTQIVCSTSGRAFINNLQSMLNVTVDGAWGASTAAALLSLLRLSYADASLIAGVQAESTLRQVGIWQVAGAIWAMHQYRSIGSAPASVAFADITLPGNAVLPTWGVATQAGPSGDLSPSCTIVGGAVIAPPVSTDNSQAQVSQMTTDPLSIPQPVVSTIATNTLNATIAVGVIAIAGIAAVIAGVFWYANNSDTAATRKMSTARAATTRRSTRGGPRQ